VSVMVNPVQFQKLAGVAEPRVAQPRPTQPATPFAKILESELRGPRGIRFSAHALERLESRELAMSPTDQARIERAVDLAASKGSRETLLLMDDMALVVSVPNRTVITAVPQNELEDMVFTNIDSTVVMAGEKQEAPLPL